ncbi:TrkA-N domain-containing protein [uncultured delta proteobacterium]|uniref:TrkA-N domain-containing protein n=1 Tax=uncultured delta proteobacterium TaxID=34034 RepID=A0A212JHS5_9DELT|nr:TrkA-N domain-containing protein [uncultured delta proteobacterium]
MKFIFSQMAFFLAEQSNQRNLKVMMRFIAMVLLLIILYSVIFHMIMAMEGRGDDYSPLTGLYWTLTVMSTLGFGDITFHSDLGRMFSVVVLMSGIVLFMLVMPFTFIRFVYAPWLDAQRQAMVPVKMPETLRGHVIVTGSDSVALSVVDRLRQYAIPYVHIIQDYTLALARYDKSYSVMFGELDTPQTYRAAQVEHAALVAALNDDLKNTNIASTVREISPTVRIAASVDHVDSLDILQLAGCNYTYLFAQMLGEAMARRVLQPGMRTNTIAVLGDLSIVEVPAQYTPYVGKALKTTDLRNRFNLTAVGIWHGKKYVPAMPDTVIEEGASLLLAGTADQIRQFDGHLAKSAEDGNQPVLILGGGRVGMAAARGLERRGMAFRLVEKSPELIPANDERFVLGSAADIDTLRRADIDTTNAAIVTTHNDDLNIYLTIYCRKLRPDIQIISRATLDRNVESLYSAGANLVMSHATMAANTITTLLRPGRVVMLTEGLNIFRVAMPAPLVGLPLKDSNIRQDTQCNVVALSGADGMRVSLDPTVPLNKDDEIILIGTADAERAFMEKYPPA